MDDDSNPIILPKGYLSWSQLDCWMKNKPRYIKEYFEDGKRLDTRYLRFGGQFSRMVEDLGEIMKTEPNRALAIAQLANAYPIDERMCDVLMELDIEGISEYQIGNSGRPDDKSPIVKVRGIVPILAFLDKLKPDNAIGEYKTGIGEWTLAKVQKHDQLTMYGVGLKWAGRPLPAYADLHWIETRETEVERVDFWRDGEKIISATGKIKSFHREFDEREFDRMEDIIIKGATEISDAYKAHLSDI